MHQDAAPPASVEVFCYSQHLRGLIRTRVQQLVSECIELRLSTNRLEPGRFKALRIAGQTWDCSLNASMCQYKIRKCYRVLWCNFI